MPCQTPIIVALDFPDAATAVAMADRLNPTHCRVKVGKELFTAAGPQVVEALQNKGFEVFLDLKFHDIPNTTAGGSTDNAAGDQATRRCGPLSSHGAETAREPQTAASPRATIAAAQACHGTTEE